MTRIHTQKTKVAVLLKIDALYFHFCNLLFICIILAPIYKVNNYEKCSVGISLNGDCNSLTFCCLIGKTPVESLSDSDKQCFSEPIAHLLMKIVFVIMKSSITF